MSRALFEASRSTSLYEAIFNGKEVCATSLAKSPEQPILSKQLPPTLHVQLNNCTHYNKCQQNICILLLFVAKGLFKEVFISFSMVKHTHDDIDASIGCWSMKLHEEDFSTISPLMKLYMVWDIVPIIPHFIEKVLDFKAVIKPFILKGGDLVVNDTKA